MKPPQDNFPYDEGETLILNITQGLSQDDRTIQVKIIHSIQPSTLSCVMKVETLTTSDSATYPNHLILKLFDWRYSTQMRRDHRVDPWTQAHEDAYLGSVQKGDALRFIAAASGDSEEGICDEPWDMGRKEAFLCSLSRKLHKCEVKTYDHLKPLQGTHIPQFFADVSLHLPSPQSSLFSILGILIEFIDGYTLSHLDKNSPPSTWQAICNQAIHVVDLISDNGVLDEDVKLHNFIVQNRGGLSENNSILQNRGHLSEDNFIPENHGDPPEQRVFKIDFAQCRFREDFQSEAEWKHEKWGQDEEGAVGYIMAHKWKGIIEYKPSFRYMCGCSECTCP